MEESFPKSPKLAPKDHAEAVARFRSEIVGALTRKELQRGELRTALRALTEERFRPPGAEVTRRIAFTTLERWYYAYRRGGLDALRPLPRGDRGHGLAPPLLRPPAQVDGNRSDGQPLGDF